MHLFFNDPRDEYVTRHRRIARPSLAALVVGGVGVAAIGVIVGAAGYDDGRAGTRTEAEAGGFALPVATAGETRTAGPLGMSTVPAAPVPILDLGAIRTAVPTPPSVSTQNKTKNADKAVVRVERSTPMPAQTTPAAAPTTEAPVVVVETPPVAEPVIEEPPEEEPDGQDDHVGRHRWHQQDQWNPFGNRDGRQWGSWWERR
ncbi:hypothetical protein [Dactylosporangium sp. CS-033363]|uniref:hypothetical protein n=1 Tax=Dactylosporangium sp. CS-033363 TaxID=3239935 RepID=UPI003D93565F